MDVLKNYIHATRQLYCTYLDAKQEFDTLSKTVTNNRICLDVLESNLASTCLPAITTLRECINKNQDELHQKSNKLTQLKTALECEKQSCITLMSDLQILVHKLSLNEHSAPMMTNVVDANVPNEVTPESVILTKCAKTLYDKLDNHDLRCEPAINGVYKYKDECVKWDSIQPTATTSASNVSSSWH